MRRPRETLISLSERDREAVKQIGKAGLTDGGITNARKEEEGISQREAVVQVVYQVRVESRRKEVLYPWHFPRLAGRASARMGHSNRNER